MIFTSYAVAVAAILGAAAGAAAARGLQGKTTPKAYIVTEVEITGDREAYQRDYAAHAAATVEPPPPEPAPTPRPFDVSEIVAPPSTPKRGWWRRGA